MTHQAIMVVDLEDRLRNDDGGTIRDELVTKFHDEANRTKQQMDGGLSPDDFETAQLLHTALESAETAVSNYWNMAHAARLQG